MTAWIGQIGIVQSWGEDLPFERFTKKRCFGGWGQIWARRLYVHLACMPKSLLVDSDQMRTTQDRFGCPFVFMHCTACYSAKIVSFIEAAPRIPSVSLLVGIQANINIKIFVVYILWRVFSPYSPNWILISLPLFKNPRNAFLTWDGVIHHKKIHVYQTEYWKRDNKCGHRPGHNV